MSDNQNNNNKNYSIGCVTICSIIVVALIVSSNMRQGLGWFWIVLLLIMLGCIVFSIYELLDKKTHFKQSKFAQFFVNLFSTKPSSQEPQKYETKPAIATQKEQEFYLLLSTAIQNNYAILQQVSLNSIIDKKLQNTFRNELFRSIDFVIADPNTTQPLLLIELNDLSHLRPDRQARDQKVKEICDIAQIPLLTFWTKDYHTVDSIKQQLQQYIRL